MELEGLERALLKSDAWRRFTQSAVLPWLLKDAALPDAAEVLEVGAGGGFNAEALLNRFPRWRMTATDYDAEMVGIARKRLARFGARVRTLAADASALPYADDAFDVTCSITVGHHVGDWEVALAESARVLRPGGWLLMADLLEPAFENPIGKRFPPVRAYSLGQLRDALGKAGFARWRIKPLARVAYRLLAQAA